MKALERSKILREAHLPLGHLQMRIGETEAGERFWSIWPDGQIGAFLPQRMANGFIDDPEVTARQFEAIAAQVRALAGGRI